MSRTLAGILALLLLSGCTNLQLKRSTLDQASTLTDLQYRQVLSNLAMFSKNAEALPFHINLKDGSAQIADTGSLGVLGGFGRSMGYLSSGSPSISGSRTVVDQWSMVPVTNDVELELLRMAYHDAFGAGKTLADDEDFANELGHELAKQTEVTAEMQEDNALLQAEHARNSTIAAQYDDSRASAGRRAEHNERVAPITYRLFEKTWVTSYDTCLECDLGRPQTHEVWIEATKKSYLSDERTFLFNHGGGTNNLRRLRIKAGDSVIWINNDSKSHRAHWEDGNVSPFTFDTKLLNVGAKSEAVKFETPTGPDGIDYLDETGKRVGKIVVTASEECEDSEAGEARIRTILFENHKLDNKLPRQKLDNRRHFVVEEAVEIEAGQAVAWINRGPNPIQIQIRDIVTNEDVVFQKSLSTSDDDNMSDTYFYSGFATRAAFVPRFLYTIIDMETNESFYGQVSVSHKRVKSPLVKEVCRQLADVESDLKEIPSGWFHIGRKKDVPKDACYVGNYGDCYAWVSNDGLGDLSLFTLKILSLSTLLQDRQVVSGTGVRYSPGLSNPARF